MLNFVKNIQSINDKEHTFLATLIGNYYYAMVVTESDCKTYIAKSRIETSSVMGCCNVTSYWEVEDYNFDSIVKLQIEQLAHIVYEYLSGSKDPGKMPFIQTVMGTKYLFTFGEHSGSKVFSMSYLEKDGVSDEFYRFPLSTIIAGETTSFEYVLDIVRKAILSEKEI